MNKLQIGRCISIGAFFLASFCSTGAHAATWDATADYSSVNNPNGAWSYGRKFTTGGGFDVMNIPWEPLGWDVGWGFGNVGHGGPSIQPGPILWSKDNSNGMAVVRWTSPQAGLFNLDSRFTGIDTRGGDNFIYITINDSLVFNDHINGYLDTAIYSENYISLQSGDYIDFMIKWAGGASSETGWTDVNATISSVPIPSAVWLFSSGVIGLIGFLKRKNLAS